MTKKKKAIWDSGLNLGIKKYISGKSDKNSNKVCILANSIIPMLIS